jgi:hypothetical protein
LVDFQVIQKLQSTSTITVFGFSGCEHIVQAGKRGRCRVRSVHGDFLDHANASVLYCIRLFFLVVPIFISAPMSVGFKIIRRESNISVSVRVINARFKIAQADDRRRHVLKV